MIPCPACLRNVTVNRHAIHTLFLVLPVWSTCNSTVTVFTALFTTGTLCLVVEFNGHSVHITIYNRNTLSCRGIQQYSVCSTIYNRNTLSCRGIQQSQCLQHYLQQEHFVLSWNSRVTVFTALFTTGTLCLVVEFKSHSVYSTIYNRNTLSCLVASLTFPTFSTLLQTATPLHNVRHITVRVSDNTNNVRHITVRREETTPTMSDRSLSVCQTTPTMSDILLSVCQTTPQMLDISHSVCQTTPTMSDISHSVCQTMPTMSDISHSVCQAIPSWPDTGNAY